MPEDGAEGLRNGTEGWRMVRKGWRMVQKGQRMVQKGPRMVQKAGGWYRKPEDDAEGPMIPVLSLLWQSTACRFLH